MEAYRQSFEPLARGERKSKLRSAGAAKLLMAAEGLGRLARRHGSRQSD